MQPLHSAAFVGRAEAMALLDAALERACQFAAPQFVTVLGTLGMGKTRLVEEWTARVRERSPARLVLAGAAAPAEGQDAEPMGLVATFLRNRFGVQPDDAPERAADRFRAELRAVFGDRRVAEVAALLGRFLGLDMAGSPLSQVLADRPEQEAELQLAVLARFLEQDATRRPLVVVLDDAHLADDGSLDLVARLGAQLGEARIVVLVASRPELLVRRPDWGRGQGNHARVELSPLGAPEIDVAIASMLGAAELAPGLAERAAVEAGGNPFLLEQLLRVYLQHGILVAETAESWTFDAERAERQTMALTAEELAQSRLGALGPVERDVLARGAAFGPVFWTGGVVALGRLDAEPSDPTSVFAPDPSIQEVRRLLTDLEERGYLSRVAATSLAGETEWAWKSGEERTLVGAMAAPELMRRRRRFAAQWLETRLGGAGHGNDARLEILGRLYEEGGDARRAAYCLIAAADLARDRRQLERARSAYLRGLRLLDVDDAITKMDAYHKLGDAAMRLGRAREALAHFGEMLRLAWRLDMPAKGGAAHDRIGRLHRAMGDYKRALVHFGLARHLFDLAGDLPGIAAALDDTGRVHALSGDPDSALRCHGAALALRQRIGDGRSLALTLGWIGEAEHERGALPQAAAYLTQALELHRKAGDGPGVVGCLLALGGVERDWGRSERAVAVLEEARTLARRHGERLFECAIAIELGDCRLGEGRPRDAARSFRQARDLAARFGARALEAEAARGLAETLLALGEATPAAEEARLVLAAADKLGAVALAGAALRVLAAAVGLGAPGDPDRGGAREIFDRAVETLAEANAEIELGRTLAAYADFEERIGRRAAATALRRQADAIRDKSRGVTRRRGGVMRARLGTVPVALA